MYIIFLYSVNRMFWNTSYLLIRACSKSITSIWIHLSVIAYSYLYKLSILIDSITKNNMPCDSLGNYNLVTLMTKFTFSVHLLSCPCYKKGLNIYEKQCLKESNWQKLSMFGAFVDHIGVLEILYICVTSSKF